MFEASQHKPDIPANTLLNYQGNLTPKESDELIFHADTILQVSEPNVKIRKKVFSILVEIVQNIHQYSSDIRESGGSETKVEFVLKKNLDGYQIISGNTIARKRIPSFRRKLDRVNNMDRELLRQTYLEQLGNGKFSASGGAGIGLMHIARKSGKKINYHFSRYSQSQSYFSLEVYVSA